MKIYPNDPAFPIPEKSTGWGLTKREYFAAMAMQGLIANPQFRSGIAKEISVLANEHADALIEALNKEQS